MTDQQFAPFDGFDLPTRHGRQGVFDWWAYDFNDHPKVSLASLKVLNDDGQVAMFAAHDALLFSSIADLARAAIWNKSPQPVMWAKHEKTRQEGGLTLRPIDCLRGLIV